MNKLREEFCKETNVPMGLDNVIDYVQWLEHKLNKQAIILGFLEWMPNGIDDIFELMDTPKEVVDKYIKERNEE